MKQQPTKKAVFVAFLKLTGLFITLVLLMSGESIIEAILSNLK